MSFSAAGARSQGSRGGAVNSQHGRAVTHASAVLPELQERRRLQQWFRDEVLRAVLTDLANTLRDDGEVD